MACLRSCCGCCSLKTGTIVSGVTGIVLSIISIIVMFTTTVEFKTIVIDWLPPLVVKIILCINLCMTILISTLLILGAIKRNTFLMLPWVVLGLMLAIALLVSIIYTATVFYLNKQVFNGTVWLVFGTVSIIIYVYMWFVVFSYFQELRDDESRGRYAKAPYKR